MILEAYSIFDSKAVVYSPPFFAQREAVARRMFADLVNDPKSAIYRNPEDYSLFWIGTFDDELGIVVSDKPRNLVTASALVKQSEPSLFSPEVLNSLIKEKVQ